MSKIASLVPPEKAKTFIFKINHGSLYCILIEFRRDLPIRLVKIILLLFFPS